MSDELRRAAALLSDERLDEAAAATDWKSLPPKLRAFKSFDGLLAASKGLRDELRLPALIAR